MSSSLKQLLLFLILVKLSHSQCQHEYLSSSHKRLMCIVNELTDEDPLDFEDKTPEILYVTVSRGEITKGSFIHLNPKKELWFIGGNITFVQPGAFRNLSRVHSMAITNSSITSLSKDTFVGLLSLETLSLNHNKIKRIDDGAFNGLEKLVQLILDHNQITRLNDNTFVGLPKLQTLFLNDNPVEFVEEDSIRNIEGLSYLHITLVKDKNVKEEYVRIPNISSVNVTYI